MEYTTNLLVCEVVWYDETENIERTEYTLCSALSMAECVQELETFYGLESIVSVKMLPLEPGPVIVSKHIADLFAKGDPSEAYETRAII